MLPAERRKIILEHVESRRSASVAELCDMLSVSEMTVRRDLRILASEGRLQRVYGGAILRHGRSYEPPYPTRQTVNPHLKEAIGRRAAKDPSAPWSTAQPHRHTGPNHRDLQYARGKRPL